ncbi:hypothetical protein KI387_008347, partial [Taxus chinensis]
SLPRLKGILPAVGPTPPAACRGLSESPEKARPHLVTHGGAGKGRPGVGGRGKDMCGLRTRDVPSAGWTVGGRAPSRAPCRLGLGSGGWVGRGLREGATGAGYGGGGVVVVGVRPRPPGAGPGRRPGGAAV